MKPADQINTVATLLPTLIQEMDAVLSEVLETRDHNIVLLIGVADMQQYAANIPREAGIDQLKGLLGRWQVGLADSLPGEVASGDTQPFEYLLTDMEHQATYTKPPTPEYQIRRRELINYVGRLVAMSNRK